MATTRFIGTAPRPTSPRLMLAAVSEKSLRQLGDQAVPAGAVDWHDLSLRIAARALATFPQNIHAVVTEAVLRSVTDGFDAKLASAVVIAALSILASWWLVGSADNRTVRT